MSAQLKMRGIAEDKTTVLWTEAIGGLSSITLSNAGATANFVLPTSYYTHVAPYLQFELIGWTSVAKQTVAGTITVDYFYELETINAVGSSVSAGLPNITGTHTTSTSSAAGAFTESSSGDLMDRNEGGGVGKWGRVYFDASRSSTIYGNSTTVRPTSLATRYFIKY